MIQLPISEAREGLTGFPDQLWKSHKTIAVTKRGKPVLAIMLWDEYESLVETLEILSDTKLMKSIRIGIRQIKQGKVVPWEDVKRKMKI